MLVQRDCEDGLSNRGLQVGDRVVAVPRSGPHAGNEITARVLAIRGVEAMRVAWSLEPGEGFNKGVEFLVVGREFRRRCIFIEGDDQTANLIMREPSGDGRSNRRFARVTSVLRYSWRKIPNQELQSLEFRVRDASGGLKRLAADMVAPPKTQLGDYLDKRFQVIEQLLFHVLERLEEQSASPEDMREALCDLSGNGMVFPVDDGAYQVAVSFTAINPEDQEAIVRYNFQVERARRRKAVEGEGRSTEFTGELPAVGQPARGVSAHCSLQLGDHVEVTFTLPLEVPTEIHCVARVVRIDSGR